MSKTRIKTQYNYKYKIDTAFENTIGDSLTVPDGSYSIRELVDKHLKGLPVDSVVRNEHFDEDVTHEDYDKRELLNSDLTEQEAVIKENQQNIVDKQEAIQKTLDEEQATKERKAKSEENEKIVKASENSHIKDVEKQENE